MNATSNSFSAITSQEKVLRIPFFQRKYVWGTAQWEKLWDDLTDSFENEDSHFLGSVILKQVGSSMGSERLVIDGQQRLTTFTILVKAIYDTIGKDNIKDKVIESKIISVLYSEYSDLKKIPKIRHSKNNKESFYAVLCQENIQVIGNEKDNIITCYLYFRKKLEEIKQDNNLLDMLKTFIEGQIWVHITVDEHEDEQRIFDSINTSGLPLSEMDVVKNFLFKFKDDKNMEKASKLYDEYWKPVFDEDQSDVNFWDKKRTLGRVERSNADVLLHCIALIEDIYNPSTKGQKLDKIGSLYKYNINKEDDRDSAREDLINKILDYAKIFRNLPFTQESSEYSLESSALERFLQIVDALDMSTVTPLALYLEYRKEKEQVSDEDYKNCLKLLEQYIIRRAIRNLSNKQYNKIVYDILRAIKGKPNITEIIEQHLRALQGDSEVFPTAEEISGVEFSNFKPRLSRILLFWVELQRQAVNDQYGETLKLSYQQYQLEHFMPQKWEKNWPLTAGISEEKREASLNMIGNFTLLKAKLNVLVGNSVWSDKVNGKIVKKNPILALKNSVSYLYLKK